IGASGYFESAGEQRMRRILEVNLFAPVELCRLALPYLLGTSCLARSSQARPLGPKGKMIVNIASILGRRGVPGYSEDCASKFALCGWSEAVRAELDPHHVHVCLICPGLIDTPFREHQIEDKLRNKWQKLRAMSAERCARKIVGAMRWRWSEQVITLDGR